MHALFAFCFFNVFVIGFTEDGTAADAIDKKVSDCIDNTPDDANEKPLVPKSETTRLVGPYCIFRLAIEYIDDKKVISTEFGPVFPTPENCNTRHKDVDGRFNLTCCYMAGNNVSYIDPTCHYSTILPLVEALQQAEEDNGDGPITDDVVEPAPLFRQRIRKNADYCEPSGALGYHGKPSRRCTPGGKGCFLVSGLEDSKEAVIASRTGRGEELMATSKDSFDRYHKALICLTEEAKRQCHAVYDGTRWTKVCCCEVTTVRKHVARCKEDSNLRFNENQFVAANLKMTTATTTKSSHRPKYSTTSENFPEAAKERPSAPQVLQVPLDP